MQESLLEKLGWKQHIGMETETKTGEPVQARDIRRYALAIDESNPEYYDEQAAKKGRYGKLAAPPGFICWSIQDPKLEKRYDELGEDGLSNFLGVPEFPDAWSLGWVRAGEEYEFFKPVFVGDTISVKLKLLDVYEKQGRSGHLIFTTSEARYTNQNGELLAIQKIIMIATPRKEETND
jgi:acyl dehydratase